MFMCRWCNRKREDCTCKCLDCGLRWEKGETMNCIFCSKLFIECKCNINKGENMKDVKTTQADIDAIIIYSEFLIERMRDLKKDDNCINLLGKKNKEMPDYLRGNLDANIQNLFILSILLKEGKVNIAQEKEDIAMNVCIKCGNPNNNTINIVCRDCLSFHNL